LGHDILDTNLKEHKGVGNSFNILDLIKFAVHMVKRIFVKKIREKRMMSKVELAKKAGVAINTINRIESNLPCRIESKRKILLGLGYDISEKDKVFPEG
jgi:DNA-binding XRE family transcriptional regulator